MSFLPQAITPAPEETRQVARAAFPKGNRYARLRDAIGGIFDRPLFAPRFPTCGQPSESLWRLAPITVMEFFAGLCRLPGHRGGSRPDRPEIHTGPEIDRPGRRYFSASRA